MKINPNHRGHSKSGRFAFRPLIQYEEDDFPPHSIYWCRRVQSAIDYLATLDIEWKLWYNEVLENEPEITCKDMYFLVIEKTGDIERKLENATEETTRIGD